ncbi:MAG: hypothetical protein ACTSSI_17030 [Candidatus Helarchaeota archaeon]
MYGDISDEKANDLIYYLSENIRKGIMGRSVIESQLFPVTTYISTACYILYDQGFEYRVMKEVAKKIKAETIARRCKTPASYLNQLAFHTLKATPDPIETEEQKFQTKFILDYWQNLSPNYRNDGMLTAEDGGNTIVCLDQNVIDRLYSEMIPVKEKSIISKMKRTTAMLTNYNFLMQAECRAGIFEHGPYYVEGTDEVIFFKEFQFLYDGKEIGDMDLSKYIDHIKTKHVSPIGNVIFGFGLRGMEEVQFNDWGTSFFKPPDYIEHISSMGMWTKEYTHPKDYRYPDKLGNVVPVKFDVMNDLQAYAQGALNEFYLRVANWDYMKKLMLGVNLYANFIAFYAVYAGMENEFAWNWVDDVLENKQRNDLVDIEKVKGYIKRLQQNPAGAHPFLGRFFRSKKQRKKDPTLYFLSE